MSVGSDVFFAKQPDIAKPSFPNRLILKMLGPKPSDAPSAPLAHGIAARPPPASTPQPSRGARGEGSSSCCCSRAHVVNLWTPRTVPDVVAYRKSGGDHSRKLGITLQRTSQPTLPSHMSLKLKTTLSKLEATHNNLCWSRCTTLIRVVLHHSGLLFNQGCVSTRATPSWITMSQRKPST